MGGEHNNLNATHPRKLEELAERLKVLNIPGSLPGNPGYIEPWQGCQSPVVNVMCDVSINNLGGHGGPFLNVDNCRQCVHTTQGYLQECAAGRATSNGELCVPPTSNECQCYTTLRDQPLFERPVYTHFLSFAKFERGLQCPRALHMRHSVGENISIRQLMRAIKIAATDQITRLYSCTD